MKDNHILKNLFSSLKTGDDFDKIEAAFNLSKYGIWDGVDILIHNLRNKEWERRLDAINYLGRLGVFETIDELRIIALNDSMSVLRNEAIYALQAIGYAKVIPYIIDALQDGDFERRTDARTALYRLVGNKILPLLNPEEEEFIENDYQRESSYLRNAGEIKDWWSIKKNSFIEGKTYCFGELAHPKVLIQVIENSEPELCDSYFRQLEDWTGQNFGEPSKKTLNEWKAWCKKSEGSYIEGERYFYGRKVNR